MTVFVVLHQHDPIPKAGVEATTSGNMFCPVSEKLEHSTIVVFYVYISTGLEYRGIFFIITTGLLII